MLCFMRYERRLLRPNGNVSGAGNDRRRYMEVNGLGGTASGPVGENFYRGVLRGNALKIIACVSMLVDHIGMIQLLQSHGVNEKEVKAKQGSV